MMPEQELDDHIQELEQDLMFFKEKYEQIQEKLDQVEEFKKDLEEQVDVQSSNIDFDRLAEFVNDQYWLINEIGENEYEIWIPKFMDVQAGVLDRQKGGYNVFILDQTTKLISGIPEFLKDDVDMDDEQRFKVKGDLLEFNQEKKEVVEEELDEHVQDVKDEKATIKQDHGHALVRDLLDRGEMPFTPTPVDEDDLRSSETTHELYDYQDDAFQEWLEHGAVTVAYMTGSGKTHIGIEAFDRLKYDAETGRKAVVVWSKITAKQWENRINEYAPRLTPVNMSGKNLSDIPDDEDVVEIYTYHNLDKLEEMINSGKEYVMIQFDEADFLPAKTFSRASTYPAKYRMGHTASPIRSRENPNDVFALCGRPVGMDWKDTLDQMEQEMFPVNIHVVQDEKGKLERTEEILDADKTTLIIVERIEFGEELSERLGLEFIHGGTSGDQKEQVQDAISNDNAVVVSRIGRRGMSLGNVERLIEVDRRGDSRRDIIQAVGRLFHGHGEQADVVYTVGEANSYEDTFYGLFEKGFEINDVDDALEMEDLGESAEGVVDIQVEGGEKIEPAVEQETASTHPGSEPDDPVEFLKHPEIKKIVKEAIQEGSFPDDLLRKSILAIASSENGLTNQEIAQDVGKPDRSNKYKFTKPFRDKDLLVKEDGRFVLNTENMSEIIEEYQKSKQRQKEIEELEQELQF